MLFGAIEGMAFAAATRASVDRPGLGASVQAANEFAAGAPGAKTVEERTARVIARAANPEALVESRVRLSVQPYGDSCGLGLNSFAKWRVRKGPITVDTGLKIGYRAPKTTGRGQLRVWTPPRPTLFFWKRRRKPLRRLPGRKNPLRPS